MSVGLVSLALTSLLFLNFIILNLLQVWESSPFPSVGS